MPAYAISYIDEFPGMYLIRKILIASDGMDFVRIARKIARTADLARPRRPWENLQEEIPEPEIPESQFTEEDFAQAALEEANWKEGSLYSSTCPVCGLPPEPDEFEVENICDRCNWQNDGTSAGWSGANGEFIEDAKKRWSDRHGN